MITLVINTDNVSITDSNKGIETLIPKMQFSIDIHEADDTVAIRGGTDSQIWNERLSLLNMPGYVSVNDKLTAMRTGGLFTGPGGGGGGGDATEATLSLVKQNTLNTVTKIEEAKTILSDIKTAEDLQNTNLTDILTELGLIKTAAQLSNTHEADIEALLNTLSLQLTNVEDQSTSTVQRLDNILAAIQANAPVAITERVDCVQYLRITTLQQIAVSNPTCDMDIDIQSQAGNLIDRILHNGAVTMVGRATISITATAGRNDIKIYTTDGQCFEYVKYVNINLGDLPGYTSDIYRDVNGNAKTVTYKQWQTYNADTNTRTVLNLDDALAVYTPFSDANGLKLWSEQKNIDNDVFGIPGLILIADGLSHTVNANTVWSLSFDGIADLDVGDGNGLQPVYGYSVTGRKTYIQTAITIRNKSGSDMAIKTLR